ncbi:MAG TPA: hypothetical protein P5234_02755 [Thermoanaerobaculaceae bacterium]|nr:hypothetical protein [Thermoanaerobaculaceae bacterium]HRS15148.1 hypothetical protein [Thermoanaerobaculaceae bacterium]
MPEAPFNLRAISLRELLDEGLRLTRQSFRRLYLPFAIPVALAATAMTVIQAGFYGAVGEAGGFGGDPTSVMAGFGATMIAMLAYVALYLLANTAMLGAMVWTATGEPAGPARAWRWAVSSRVLGTLVLQGLLIGIGLLFCVVPGIVVMLRLWLTGAVMAGERQYGADALRRSAELLTHNPERKLAASPQLKVIAIVFATWLVSAVATMAVNLPFAIAQQIIVFRSIVGAGGDDAPAAVLDTLVWFQAPQALLGGLVTVAVGLYSAALGALFFLDLCRRREGDDLEAALDELGAPRPPVAA